MGFLRLGILLALCLIAAVLSASCFASETASLSPLASLEIREQPNPAFLPLVTADLCTPRPGRAFFVSPDGTDEGPGIEARPFQTIQRALDSAEPGDTVYVTAGTYHENVAIRRSGTVCSPITVSGYGLQRPVIDGGYMLPDNQDAACDPVSGNCFNYGGLITVSASHIAIEGLEIAHSRGRGLRLLPTGDDQLATDITIRDNLVRSSRNAGIHAMHYSQLRIEGNELWDNNNYATYPRSPDSGLPWVGALSVKFCEGAVVVGNTVHNNWGGGIQLANTNQIVVDGNTAYDNRHANVYCNTCGHAVIRRNLVYSSSAEVPPSKGIVLGLDWATQDEPGYSTDHLITNNIVIGTQFLFSFHVFSLGGDAPGRGALINTVIANNTFVNANANGTSDSTGNYEPAAIWIEPRVEHDNVRIENNIFVQDPTKGRLANVPDDRAFHWGHNLWSGTPPPAASGFGDVVGDPRLQDAFAILIAGEVDPSSYQLTYGSPAVDAGKAITEVADDFFLGRRGSKPDIGAHELLVGN